VLAGFDLITPNCKGLVPLDDDDLKTFELEPNFGLTEQANVSLSHQHLLASFTFASSVSPLQHSFPGSATRLSDPLEFLLRDRLRVHVYLRPTSLHDHPVVVLLDRYRRSVVAIAIDGSLPLLAVNA
jgi:hypothetical protein